MTHMVASTVPAQATHGWRRWFPNALTGLRLLIAIAFFTLLAVWNYPARELVVSPRHPLIAYLVAAALFGLAAVTDAIDGPLARRWKVVSAFGRIMDPFADKVLVVGGFIMLAGPTFGTPIADGEGGLEMLHVSGVHTWMVVVILGRELLVTSIRAVAESQGHDFSATWSGKAKMILQACVIPLILIVLGFTRITPGTWGRWVIDIAVWLTVGVTILSGVPYLHRAIKLFGRPKP